VGLIVVAILSIVLIIERRGGATAAAGGGAIRCGAVRALPSEGVEHLLDGVSPPVYATRPAASGIHTDASLPPNIHVYTEPIPEETALHNLEHAYVLIYYRFDGAGALPADVVDALAGLAEGEDKVILAPYPALEPGTSLAFVAWQRLQECGFTEDADAAVEVAERFVGRFRGGGVAPEPSGP
jgi:hypothetical protein